MNDQATRLTERHVIERARRILEEARGHGYFQFRCSLQQKEPFAIKLKFGNGGRVYYDRQIGWRKFFEDCGGQATFGEVIHFRCVVEEVVLSADGIEPWER